MYNTCIGMCTCTYLGMYKCTCTCMYLLSTSVSAVRWNVLEGVTKPNECSRVPPSSRIPLNKCNMWLNESHWSNGITLRRWAQYFRVTWHSQGHLRHNSWDIYRAEQNISSSNYVWEREREKGKRKQVFIISYKWLLIVINTFLAFPYHFLSSTTILVWLHPN